MAGGEGAVRDHRLWWTGLVSSVTHAQRAPRVTGITATDEAPMIGLVAAIGSKTQIGAIANLSEKTSDWMTWLFLILTLALIGEVTSRRLGGAL
jgi:hypothetical protein